MHETRHGNKANPPQIACTIDLLTTSGMQLALYHVKLSKVIIDSSLKTSGKINGLELVGRKEQGNNNKGPNTSHPQMEKWYNQEVLPFSVPAATAFNAQTEMSVVAAANVAAELDRCNSRAMGAILSMNRKKW
ncbi:hypothetical protein Tco_0898089 [Tanacetum coccineum]